MSYPVAIVVACATWAAACAWLIQRRKRRFGLGMLLLIVAGYALIAALVANMYRNHPFLF